jgi:hypothetical protein
MHYAKLKDSKRLQRVLSLLQDGAKHSTRDIVLRAGVCAVNSVVSELRANGITVNCDFRGRTENGDSIFEYYIPESSTMPV